MNDNSLYKLGGICSVGAAIGFVAFSVLAVVDPVFRGATGPDSMMQLIATQGTHHYLYHVAFALTALFLMGTIPAMSALVREGNEGWIQLAAILGYIGFGLTAVVHMSVPEFEVQMAKAFVDGDLATRAAVMQASTVEALDPNGWFMFGAAGVWAFVAHWFALRKNVWPRTLAILGLSGGLLYWGLLVARLFQIQALADGLGLLGGIILGPVLYVWLGVFLHRQTCPVRKQAKESSNLSAVPSAGD